jgi:poly-gamma-glutamate synthesis protein (capsule biosynthesis protein)
MPLLFLFLLTIVSTSACNYGDQPMATVQDTDAALNHPLMGEAAPSSPPGKITLFLCGDVMTGRGIDQVLPHSVDPVIYEPYLRSAAGYVQLAEGVHGPIPRPVDYSYIWGDALAVLERHKPDLRLINLETSVTTSPDYWPDKGINYRMHPGNIPCLSAARIDCCVLANNHVLDWGYPGLLETLKVLEQAGIAAAGAGRDQQEAQTPARLEIEAKGRLLVHAYGSYTSGVPGSWAATEERPGVNLLPDFSAETILRIKNQVAAFRQPGDVVLFSLHWGGNWGYEISDAERRFAHRLIDEAGIDAVYGHSSHHVKGIEVYQGKLILYGCGDFLNDYEGIGGYEEFRGDLSLMYFPGFDPVIGRLVELRMQPMQIKRFQTIRATRADVRWLQRVLNREGKRFGTRAELLEDGSFFLHWE